MVYRTSFLRRLTLFVCAICVLSNIYIYTYPSLNPGQCNWKYEDKTEENEPNSFKRYIKDLFATHHTLNSDDISILALGDPQIKGIWPSTPYITRLDTFGNDYYLGHIFNTMYKRLKPRYVAVMGDLFSSQWIGDSEFFNRTVRYTKRLFGRDDQWLKDIKTEHHDENNDYQIDWKTYADTLNEMRAKPRPFDVSFGYEDVYKWTESDDYLFINVTGNHDIGYSGDTTYQHMARYIDLFGKDNYWIEYDKETDHPWRIVVLNNILLEGPALQPELLDMSWEFLYQLFERNFNGSTVLFTHIPFFKLSGLCYDGPQFRYYSADHDREPYKATLLRSQNHLSEPVSKRVLNLVFSNDKPGIILTGHDHEGCETYYNRNSTEGTWTASKTMDSTDLVIQEVTIRSVMGEFDGNTGLILGHFNKVSGKWQWSFNLCPFAVQHIWWFTKVVTIITGFLLSLCLFL